MTDINGIPTEPFDPSKHLVECREVTEGRTVFVTLQSLMDAEDVIDAQQGQALPGPVIDPEALENLARMLGERTAGMASQDDLAALEERVVRSLRDQIPPPQFPADILQVLTDTTAALVEANKKIAALEQTVAVHTANFGELKGMIGGGE